MKTLAAKPAEVTRRWYIVDADGKVLGRLASAVAQVLRGKHKPIFTPHVDCGDGVIVINAAKVRLTGRKADQKTYFRHSGYMGGREVDTVQADAGEAPGVGDPARGPWNVAQERPWSQNTN